MNGAAWFGIGALAGILASAGFYLVLRYAGGASKHTGVPDAGSDPAAAAAQAAAEAARIRAEIAKLSDTELAERFSRLAKKEGPK